MQDAYPVEESDNLFRDRNLLKSRDAFGKLVAQEHDYFEPQQQQRRNVKQHCTPATRGEELLPRRIKRTEVQEQRREKNQGGVVEKSYRQIEVTITADWRKEQKYECSETERSKVKRIRSVTTLPKEHEETNAQEDYADEIYVEHSRRPLVNSAQFVEVGPVGAHIGRIGWPPHQVMQGATDACLLEIDLDIACGSDLFGASSAVKADADQLIARQHPGAVRGGTFLDALRQDSVLSIDPLNPVPGWSFVSDALAEVEEAGTDQ